MTQSVRKFVGMVALVLGLIVYTFAIANLSGIVLGRAWPLQTLYFLLGGLAWIVPAGGLIWWMQRPDKTEPGAD